MRSKHLRLPVRWLCDLLPLAALLSLAFAVAGFLLRDDLFIFGDHPGQYWRMWYTLQVALPLHHRLIDWMPYWYAGYPELQFYPPGYVLLAWLIQSLTVGQLSTEWTYEIVVFASYALPGLTFYYAMLHLGFGRRSALAAGVFGLIFPATIGGAAAPFIGMIGSRLAFGLNALALAWGIDHLERRGSAYTWLAIAALTAVTLSHPYHVIGIVLALALYVVIRRLPLPQGAGRLFVLVAATAALAAFWLLPLFVRYSGNAIPLVRATLDQTRAQFFDPALGPYALLALYAVMRAGRASDPGRRSVLAILTATPILIGLAALIDHAVLMERFQFYLIDPVRLVGEYYLTLLLLAATGLDEASRRLGDLARSARTRSVWAWTVALIACALLLVAAWPTNYTFYPKESGEPRFLSQAASQYRLGEVWEVLRASPGRVLFTSHYTHLRAQGGQALDTALFALTPLYTHRPVMGGTFSHWSPVAALMWVGEISPPFLAGRVEERDDSALFGMEYGAFSDSQLFAYAQRFNITTLVAGVDDFQTRTILDASPHFQSYFNNGTFFVYRVLGYDAAWVDAENASVDVLEWSDDGIALRVASAEANARVSIKLFAYPLWQVSASGGETARVERDPVGLMRVMLPRGTDYVVRLRYEEGVPERLGYVVTIITLIFAFGIPVINLILHKPSLQLLPWIRNTAPNH